MVPVDWDNIFSKGKLDVGNDLERVREEQKRDYKQMEQNLDHRSNEEYKNNDRGAL